MQNTSETYHKPNRFFLHCIGLWPHQTTFEKIVFFTISIFFIITQGCLQIGGLIMAWCNPDIFMESIPPVSIDIMCYVKLFNFMYHGDKIKMLLEIMEENWKHCIEEHEFSILCDFGNDCKKKTLMYAGAVYGSMVPFMIGPLAPLIVGFLSTDMVTNITVDRPLMFHVEYLVDVNKWYYYLLIHSYFATIVYITVVVAIDTMFFVYVQHACALFAVIGHRLEHFVEKEDLDIDVYEPQSQDKPYHNLKECISRHNEALDYVEMIESANTLAVACQLGINMICISFTGFQAVMKMEHPEESIRYVSFMVAQVFPVFAASYPSECLLNESIRLLECITRSTWYLTSIRTRRLLNLFILRSTRPAHLTAGRFYVLNLEYFATVIRTSMSYLTMLCSFK